MLLKDHNKTAIVLGDQSLSYRELLCRTLTIEAMLPKAPPDPKVAIFSENSMAYPPAVFGIWRAGRTLIPIDYLSNAAEVAYLLDDAEPEAVFCSAGTRAVLDEAIALAAHAPTVLALEDIPEIPSTAAPTELSIPMPDKDKRALIIYTSGTTGNPKGAQLSFGNVLSNVHDVCDAVPIFTDKQRVLGLLPLHHILPLMGTLVGPMYAGSTLVFCPSLAPEDIANTLRNNAITIIIGVPRFYEMLGGRIKERIEAKALTRNLLRLMEKANNPALSKKVFKKVHEGFGGHIQYMVSGGAALDKEIARLFKTLGFMVLEGYGMTECAPIITFPRPDDTKPGSCGKPMSCNEVKIVDGEVVTRGPNVMSGYYRRPEETAEVLKDGWLYTGDLGRMDEDGHLFITGRKKEILVLPSGKNINPESIERELVKLGNGLVTEAGVILDRNALFALLVADLGKAHELQISDVEQAVREQVSEQYNRNAQSYRRLGGCRVLSDPLPRTRLGKLRRHELPILAEGQQQVKIEHEPDYEEYRLLRDYLASRTDRPVYPAAHLEMDLALDSLERVSLLVFLQKTFGVEITEQELADHNTVEKLSTYLSEHATRAEVGEVNWEAILGEKTNLDLPHTGIFFGLITGAIHLWVRLYFRLRVVGREHLPKGPFILAPNHQSIMDGFFLVSLLRWATRKKTYFYAKSKHWKQAWRQKAAASSNIIIMDTNRDLKESLQKLASVLTRGRNLVIFPEGTRSKDGQLGRFKKTFAILSRELKVPVVPVSIKGTFQALPPGKRFPRPWKNIRIQFHSPVYPNDESYDELCERVRGAVNEEDGKPPVENKELNQD